MESSLTVIMKQTLLRLQSHPMSIHELFSCSELLQSGGYIRSAQGLRDAANIQLGFSNFQSQKPFRILKRDAKSRFVNNRIPMTSPLFQDRWKARHLNSRKLMLEFPHIAKVPAMRHKPALSTNFSHPKRTEVFSDICTL